MISPIGMRSTLFAAGIACISFFPAPQFLVYAESTTAVQSETPVAIKIKVAEFFAQTPVMITIAECESTFRQFTDAGNVFHDASGRYVGIFQIDEAVHTNAALALGFDIGTVDGNIRYAHYLYSKEGSRPWANCAKKYVPLATSEVSEDDVHSVSTVIDLGAGMCPKEMQVTQTLRNGSRDPKNANGIITDQVKLLQIHINRILKNQYDEAAGPVDGIFGPKTQRGVERLQMALNEIVQPKPSLVIDGIVGSFTRAAINNSCGNT